MALKKNETKEQLTSVYAALLEKGYRPIDQIVGYTLIEAPTYITNHNAARRLMARIDRGELPHDIVSPYFHEQ